jgi:LPXTG-motif cell wall-anchored protein
VTDAAPVEVAKTAPLEAVTPKEETIQTAAVVNAPPVEVATATPVAPPQPALPQTASDLPLIGLAGLLSLGAGLGLLAFSKSKA